MKWFFLLLCMMPLVCRPADFNSSTNGNGNGDPDPDDAEYKISLLQLKVKDKKRIAVDVAVTKGGKSADSVAIAFKIACRPIDETATDDDDEEEESEADYGREVSLGIATTDANGNAEHVSDKILQPTDEGDTNSTCKVSATTDDGKEHEIGTMSVNATLKKVYDLGKELTITTPDKVFDVSTCNTTKLLILQLQTIRGVTLVITANKDFTKIRREDIFNKIFVVNTVANPKSLTCEIYGNIVSMQNSVYEEVDMHTAKGFERQHEKMWLKDGDYWRPAIQLCNDPTAKTRDGTEVDDADGDVAKAPWACIAREDKLLVYYNREFKFYQITSE